MISNVLEGDFIREVPRWIDGLIIMILGLFLSTQTYRLQPLKGLTMTVLIAVAYSFLSFIVLDKINILISVVYPIVVLIFVYCIVNAYNQISIVTEHNRLIDLATKDSLTGLYIRRHFNLILETQVQMVKDRGGRLSLLMIDLDNFKNINDTHGHKTGDFVLREIAKTLLASCRPLDVVGRYGGEEFIIMLPGADESSASLVAERIRYRVKKSDFKFKDVNHKITVSVGIANYKKDDTAERLVEKADWALYKAKERGKDGIFSSEFLEEL